MNKSYIGIAGDCEHNSSVVLLENGEIIYAELEERLSGIKGDGRFPVLTLREAENLAKYSVVYCIAGNIITPNKTKMKLETLGNSNVQNIWRYGVNELIKSSKRVEFIEHHTAHMASGYFYSGFKKALIVTADGQGDGLSLTISNVDADIIRIFENQYDWGSPGFLYAAITKYLGYEPLNGEGKVTALAASGKNQVELDELFSKIFYTNESGIILVDFEYIGNYARSGPLWTKKFSDIANKFSAADVSYALQKRFEKVIIDLIGKWLRKTQQKNLIVTGGVFANVSLNRKLQELNNLDNFFITPYMGDEGTALGSTAWIYYTDSGKKPKSIKTMFLGSYNNSINKISELEFISDINVEEQIAMLLSKEQIVARLVGRMEFGPRALGNHSILYHPGDKTTISWLNERLGRSKVMPFAPAILEPYAGEYLYLTNSSKLNYEYMTTSFKVTDLMKQYCAGVVHQDDTVRPQIVKKETNPTFYKIIEQFYLLTKIPILLNTSFNIHGFPIIFNTEDAINSCKQARISFLQINEKLYRVIL